MKIQNLVQKFRQAAIEKGEFAEPASKDHKLFDLMAGSWRELFALGEEGQEAFKELLSDDSRFVRCWVAGQLLGLGDTSGVEVLEVDAAQGDIQAFNSEMTLGEWRKGRLSPPFLREKE
ncbi:hypothetical protein [Desulfoluna sp.]|uniref:hypothetical protein n=1 Tax=Desulfoluna sp. TaxID=2045199 RepID=UPI0026337F9E|nr:hypothetical protein [Desulfoluna sp.]